VAATSAAAAVGPPHSKLRDRAKAGRRRRLPHLQQGVVAPLRTPCEHTCRVQDQQSVPQKWQHWRMIPSPGLAQVAPGEPLQRGGGTEASSGLCVTCDPSFVSLPARVQAPKSLDLLASRWAARCGNSSPYLATKKKQVSVRKRPPRSLALADEQRVRPPGFGAVWIGAAIELARARTQAHPRETETETTETETPPPTHPQSH
jgi:hypothetical protein